jgi:hypothetical protein
MDGDFKMNYPQSDLDNPAALLSVLGSFWTDTFPGRDLLLGYLAGVGLLYQQIQQAATEFQASTDRTQASLGRTRLWTCLRLNDSDRLPLSNTWLLPAGFLYVPIITNRLTGPAIALPGAPNIPEVCLIRGQDFVVDLSANTITFRQDPSIDSRFLRLTGGMGATIVWLYRAAVEDYSLANRYGFPVGLLGASQPSLRNLINAVWDATTAGTSNRPFWHALTALTDIPLARTSETVILIRSDSNGIVIATEQNIYRCSSNATVLVTEGQQLSEGQSLTTGLRLYEFTAGQELPLTETTLTIPASWLLGSYNGNLSFPNRVVSTVVTLNVSGYTKITWEVDGDPAGVTAFWNDVHTRGIAQGKTLAHYLDIRPHPVGEPTAASLPTTINPADFLVANWLRDLCLVVIESSQLGPDAAGLDQLWAVQKIQPPGTPVLYHVY